MRFSYVTFNKVGGVSGHTESNIFRPMAHKWISASLSIADVVFLLIERTAEPFEFDEAAFGFVTEHRLPLVVLDYWEGVAWQDASPERAKLSKAMGNYERIVCYFRRELEVGFDNPYKHPVFPLDFAIPRQGNLTMDFAKQYDNRPTDILMAWGYSNVDRPHMHAELFKRHSRFSPTIPALTKEDVYHYWNNGQRCPLALLHLPEYRRIPMTTLLGIQRHAKVSVSLSGNGTKCWRNAEAACNSLLAQQAPDVVQWSYPWIADHNCIGLPNIAGTGGLDVPRAAEVLEHKIVMDHGSLHHLYVQCVQNANHYFSDRYAGEYIIPKVEACL